MSNYMDIFQNYCFCATCDVEQPFSIFILNLVGSCFYLFLSCQSPLIVFRHESAWSYQFLHQLYYNQLYFSSIITKSFLFALGFHHRAIISCLNLKMIDVIDGHTMYLIIILKLYLVFCKHDHFLIGFLIWGLKPHPKLTFVQFSRTHLSHYVVYVRYGLSY